MRRLMVIRSCTECRHLKIKDGFNSHYYSCTELKTRSSDMHSTCGQRDVHTELNAWFAKCTVWDNEEKIWRDAIHDDDEEDDMEETK